MKRAVIYTRVSRDDSGEGESNDRQQDACMKLAELRGWEVVAQERDVNISATFGKDRPGWNEVLNLVSAGAVDVVVAWHIDRMTRSMTDLEHLILLCEKHGVGVATVTGDIDLTNDVGRMVARILAAVARQEVERKSARQKLANKQRAERGEVHHAGVRPFGYEANGIDIKPAEADLIRDAARRVLAGVSIYQIAKEWSESGHYSHNMRSTSKRWSTTGVKGVLINPRYAGRRIHLGEDVGKAVWQPILDEETHLALRGYLTSPGRRTGGSRIGAKPQTLLTGIARCWDCDGTMQAGSNRQRKIYVCKLGHTIVPRELADDWVSIAVVERLMLDDLLVLLSTEDNGGLSESMAELPILRERLTKQIEMHADGLISDTELATGSKRLRERIIEHELVIEQAGTSVTPLLREAVLDPETWWDAAGLDDRRVVVEALCESIVVTTGGVTGQRAVPLEEKILVRFRGAEEQRPLESV